MDFSWARSLSDDEWANALVSGQSNVPTMPSVAVQNQWVGSNGKASFDEAAIFWNSTKDVASDLGQPFTSDSRLLDVGVGWGRLYRWMLRDLEPSQIRGIDIDPKTIAMCAEAHALW